jgi:hypothetical protein
MRLLVGALCLLGSVAAAAQEHPDNFAYSVPLELSGDSALHQLEIPQSVYAGVTRGDLGDLRIFNGRGENVPYALKPQPAPQTAPPVWVEVPRPTSSTYGQSAPRPEPSSASSAARPGTERPRCWATSWTPPVSSNLCRPSIWIGTIPAMA